ncbi:NAD(P)H-hydrate dehydratase [Flavobacterium sp. XGLA_31]|uniref:NAD(P)H-hydrate dehydratase n=1 Tax=Flavobacterium sp. XGLA_31 TaxID=3447666 RepID=UPI003F2FDA10
MRVTDLHSIQNIFKKRLPDSHKGSHGHVLLIAGSQAKMGAAVIAAKSALRAGAGLVTVNVPRKERKIIFTAAPEAMVTFREEKINLEKYNAFAIGPGLGTDKEAEKMVEVLIANASNPVVYDADALTLLVQRNELIELPKNAILTPHSREFDRLFGNHDSETARRAKAIQKATELECIIVLKGHHTFITDGSSSFENTTGNSGLAKGGSGDALTGIIAAFLAQGYQPLQAAILGVYLHGLAADITLETQSPESMLITDVIENLGKAFYQIQQ